MRNILNPGDAFATGQIMRESAMGLRRSLEAVKDLYKNAKYVGIGVRHQEHGNRERRRRQRDISRFASCAGPRVEILAGYTEMGQGIYTTIRQAVCQETGLPAGNHERDLGQGDGREVRRDVGFARNHAQLRGGAKGGRSKFAADLKEHRIEELVGREYDGEYVCDFTTRPGTPESKTNPTTHLTFSYATQVVILDEDGHLERVLAAHDVGHALNPRMCAEQMEGGVHMGLGYALSEKFRFDGRAAGFAADARFWDCSREGYAEDRRDFDRRAG